MVDWPICHIPMCKYKNEGFIEIICWNCGEYNSNSPAFMRHPDWFKNMVRENPQHFLEKFLELKLTDESLHEHQNRRRLYRIFAAVLVTLRRMRFDC